MSGIGMACFEGTSLATERAPRPGAGTERLSLLLCAPLSTKRPMYAKNADLRRGQGERKNSVMGALSSKAVLAFMTRCTPAPCDSMNCHAVVSHKLICIGQFELTPERVVVVGRDISVGSWRCWWPSCWRILMNHLRQVQAAHNHDFGFTRQ
jgi:hypothetical protein